MVKDILMEYLKSGKKNIVIVNIGTDKCILDSFGPILGDMIQDIGFISYGNLEKPITALNAESIIEKIKTKHKEDFIIATDAMVGAKDNHVLKMFRKGIKPGLGNGKDISRIGDISIVLTVDRLQTDRLFYIHQGARKAAKHIKELNRIIKICA